MKIPPLLLASLALLPLTTVGCSHPDEGDTSPLPNQDAQARVGKATKSIESSNMTPEQKQAAETYLKQGAANADRIKQSATGR